jgi:hypothetical protein
MLASLPLQIVEHRASLLADDVRDRGTSDLHGREDTVRRDQLPISEPLRLKIAHSFGLVLAFERKLFMDGVAEIHATFAHSLRDGSDSGRDNLARAYLLPPPHEAKCSDDDREKGDRKAANH